MAKLNPLPRFVRDLLGACPAAGAGVHNWLFCTARVLHHFYPDKRELALLLEAASANCGREVPEQEIVAAVLNSQACAWRPGETPNANFSRTPAWPLYQRERADAIMEEVSCREYPRTLQTFDRDSLIIRSPVACPDQLRAATILRTIHSRCPAVPRDAASNWSHEMIEAMGNDQSERLISAGVCEHTFGTGLLSEWEAGAKMPLPGRRRDSLLFLDDLQFVVPNEMTAQEGTAKNGKPSSRCRENAAKHRRFLIVEFDQPGDEYMQPALHWHLRELAPLVMCVESGGTSIHGWYYVEPQPEEWHVRFFRYAVSLGADHRMWWPEQFSRMPNGARRDGDGRIIAKQRVIYFDPLCMVDAPEEIPWANAPANFEWPFAEVACA